MSSNVHYIHLTHISMSSNVHLTHSSMSSNIHFVHLTHSSMSSNVHFVHLTHVSMSSNVHYVHLTQGSVSRYVHYVYTLHRARWVVRYTMTTLCEQSCTQGVYWTSHHILYICVVLGGHSQWWLIRKHFVTRSPPSYDFGGVINYWLRRVQVHGMEWNG